MDIILDTDSCHYRTTWEFFLDINNNEDNENAARLVLLDCVGQTQKTIKKKVKKYKSEGKMVFLINASPKQAALAAAIFFEHTPVSSIAKFVKDFIRSGSRNPIANPFSLSNKEMSILHMLRHGFSNKEIARHMDIPLSTTKYYLQKIYKKMNVSNRTEAALACVKIHL